jgi:hypothetical protein
MIVLLALVAEIPILLMRRSQSGAGSTGDTGAIGSVLGTGGEALAALGARSNVSDGGVFDGGLGSGAGAGGLSSARQLGLWSRRGRRRMPAARRPQRCRCQCRAALQLATLLVRGGRAGSSLGRSRSRSVGIYILPLGRSAAN